MSNNADAYRHLDELRRCRPNSLIRLMARLMFKSGLRTNWAVNIHLRDVEYRALCSLFGNYMSESSARQVISIPSSVRLPGLWPEHLSASAEPNLALLDTAESDVLCGLCDDYWNSFQPGRREAIGEDVFVIRHSGVVVHAINLLSRRGSEILEWALARLRHPDYDAREHAAYLLGELAERGHLGEQLATVTEELAALVTRPWEEDTKEVQANTSALLSLAKIGGPILIATLRRILTSDKWDGDDLQWSAAEILSQVAGKPIMQEEAPLKAAKEWMAANP